MNEQEYLRRHLPQGASTGHDVLYDFHGVFESLSPTPDELDACLRDLVPILARARAAAELYANGHDASELALSLLARACARGTELPRGQAAIEVLAEIRRLTQGSDSSDARKRLEGIASLLAPGDADDS